MESTELWGSKWDITVSRGQAENALRNEQHCPAIGTCIGKMKKSWGHTVISFIPQTKYQRLKKDTCLPREIPVPSQLIVLKYII